ncbi:DUF1643 domain-containing protein [Singulisphaera rosea]
MIQTTFIDGNVKEAFLSPCGLYRYTLTRQWDNGPYVNWLMLNPSVADASRSDPTMVRCVNYAKAWGYGAIVLTNLFAFRATDPREMKRAEDPVGPENDRIVMEVAREAGLVVAAWGNHGSYRDRGRQVMRMFATERISLNYLSMTKEGYPSHPLRLRADLKPQRFN